MHGGIVFVFNFYLIFLSILELPTSGDAKHVNLKNGEIFEDDILMDNRLRRALHSGIMSRKSIENENSGRWVRVPDENVDEDGGGDNEEADEVEEDEEDASILWPNGIVYYKIKESFLPESRKLLGKVMRQFEIRTCIRFKERVDEKDYIVFSSDKNTCASNVGRIGGRQTIQLGVGCTSQGRFEHEIMHSLGFIHEHSRPDRDNYIKINYKNIKKKFLDDFEKYSFDEYKNLHEEFNFNSVMIYRNKAFSKNGKDTITAIGEPDLKFGQRKQFSIGDVRGINKLYKCHRYLTHPNYAGLVKEYNGNGKRRDVLRKKLIEEYYKAF